MRLDFKAEQMVLTIGVGSWKKTGCSSERRGVLGPDSEGESGTVA